jgi:pyruvate formate lyase activating enzyme
MKKELTAKLHSIETFGAVDGPGIRTVFFLQGCPARCRYCHNPDTWDMNAGAAGVLTAEEAVRKAKRCRPYYGPSGGVTFSGGEPLIHGEFLAEAIDALHEEGINCAIDTSGTYFDGKSEEVIEKADLILLDVKHTDPVEFKKLTGRDMDTLFQIIEAVNETDTSVWIRQVIVPGLNDTEEYVMGLKEFIRAVNKVEKVELLGYHSMARTKYEKLGISYPLEGVNDMDGARLKELQEIVENPL